MKHCALFSIIMKGEAEAVMKAAREAGAEGGTIITARGTATNSLLALLGLGESRREILISFVQREAKERILSAITAVKAAGIAAVLDEETDMEARWKMIEVITPDGMSEDIMAVARRAGASGGTVIKGRGTSKESDVKFFGYPIVDEKEIVIIIAEREVADRIVKELSELEVLSKAGLGVLFTLPVTDFKQLGD